MRTSFAIVLTTILCLASQAHAQRLRPLAELDQADSKITLYTLKRCNSLFVGMAALMGHSGEAQAAENLLKGADGFLASARLAGALLGQPPEGVDRDVTAITKMYVEEWSDNALRTGDYFDDRVQADIDICKTFR